MNFENGDGLGGESTHATSTPKSSPLVTGGVDSKGYALGQSGTATSFPSAFCTDNHALPFGVYTVSDGISVCTQPVAPTCAEEQALFADEIWPGAVKCADFLRKHPTVCKNKYVLELGAGAALPSLVSLALGASTVVITDFPNERILHNIKRMVIQNKFKLEHQAYVREHAWGSDTQECLDLSYGSMGFDVVLLCESFWNATYRLHRPLLASLYKLLSVNGVAIVSFSHHITDDHPPERDLEFFQLAMAAGFLVELYNSEEHTETSQFFVSEGYHQDKVQLFLLKKRPTMMVSRQTDSTLPTLRTFRNLHVPSSHHESDYRDLQ